MATTPRPLHRWLREEAEEILDEDSIGLYELVWTLNSSPYDLAASEKLDVTLAVTAEIVRDGAADLYELTWPDNEVVRGPVSIDELQSTPTGDWSEPASTYFALVPTRQRHMSSADDAQPTPNGK